MTMDRASLAQIGLERLADVYGEATEPVLARFYARHPDARASFDHHGLGRTRELEDRMVAESFFLLLQWVDNPATARIDQGTAVIHHNDTLLVPARWYLGLVDAALEVLMATLPLDADAERALWLSIRAEFADFVQSLRRDFFRSDGGEPLPAFEPPHLS
ncbi:hypothetical protein [Qipengyuania zhejiangensis]|uniref:hypothetical protein n=1 Tax=Qipengyuania zhejiangensis TaxID=3077782 RepID=UPI002D7908E9|nr:hypothetical protein [Qipengyuania sp. Z2]